MTVKANHVVLPLLVLAPLLPISLNAPSAQADTRVTTIRVLHQNIYGRDEKHCKDRYRTLARNVLEANPPFDIVSLNEHWNTSMGDLVGETCDSSVLTHALHADGRYADGEDGQGQEIDRSRLSYPRPGTFQLGGGNSLVTNHRIVRFESHDFDNSNRFPISGYMRSEIEILPGVNIDFWTTHFEAGSDNCHEKCHEAEANQLARSLILHSSGSVMGQDGNPVIIAGDLNMGGPDFVGQRAPYQGNPGYDMLMSALQSPRDLWLEAHPYPRSTEDAHTYDPSTNPIAYDAGRERIDYLLAPTDPRMVHSQYYVRVRRMEIVRWKTPDGTNISDHYGLDTSLDVMRRDP